MSGVALVPVDLYLHPPEALEPDAEYVDGVIEKRPAGEYDHATWQQSIEQWFLLHREEWNIRVRQELRIQVSATRYRVPDVVVFDRAHPIEQILTRPPIAVFEILSPEDRIARMLVKLQDYERMGISTVRVIDPATRALLRYAGGKLEPVTQLQEELPGSRCRIAWDKVQEFLDD